MIWLIALVLYAVVIPEPSVIGWLVAALLFAGLMASS